jgi:GntR family transcriptional regulator
MLDRDSPLPLYYQLAQILRSRMASGELATGDRLPSERELGQQFSISRMTVRQALAYLERQGAVRTQRGVGTVVAERRLVYDVAMLFGFVRELAFDDKRAGVQVLGQDLAVPPPDVVVALGLNGGQKVVSIQRLRIYKGTPLVLETNCFPASLCAGLEREDLTTRSLTSLRKQYGLLSPHARHSMEATVATNVEAELLQIPAGAALLLTEGETYSGDSQPVEYFKVLYRGDRFRFEMRTDGGTELKVR